MEWRIRATELVRDSEAFLNGRLAERMERTNGFAPEWTWTNLLAHGTTKQLTDERAFEAPHWPTYDEQWRAARSYLAGLVLDYAEDEPLADLQHHLLVPLELSFADRTAGDDERGPGDWVVEVEAALREHRRAHRSGRHRAQPC